MANKSEKNITQNELSNLMRSGKVKNRRGLFEKVSNDQDVQSFKDFGHSIKNIKKRFEEQEEKMSSNYKPVPKPRKGDKIDNKRVVQLYKYEDRKYIVDTNALRQVLNPYQDMLIAIYCITGKFRSGKSFLLSIFLRYFMYGSNEDWIHKPVENSFKCENTVERVTSGIWITTRPLITQNKNGQKVAVFLMDTQGWHDNKTTAAENAFVFRLSSLMSSVMIFNIQETIGEDSFHFLQTFSSTAKILDEHNCDEPFQRLFIVGRDWHYPQYDHGYYDDQTSINGNNYKRYLIDSEENNLSIEAKNIRELIKFNYQQIAVYLLPEPGRPGIYQDSFDSSAIEHMGFVSHLKNLTHLLFDQANVVAKQIGGQLITGRDLVQFVERRVNEFEYRSDRQSRTSIMNGHDNIEHGYIEQPIDYQPYLMAYQTALDYFDEKVKVQINSALDDLHNYDVNKIKYDITNLAKESLNMFDTNDKMTNQTLSKSFRGNLLIDLAHKKKDNIDIIDNLIELKNLKIQLKELDIKLGVQGEISSRINSKHESSRKFKTVQDNFEAELQLSVGIEAEIESKSRVIKDVQTQIKSKRIEERRNWFAKFIGVISNVVSKVICKEDSSSKCKSTFYQ